MNLAANQATLAFLLSCACRELFPNRMLVIEHSLGGGYFCHDARWEPYTEVELESLAEKIRAWLKDDHPLRLEEEPRDKVIEELYRTNSRSKLQVVQHWAVDPIPVVRFRQYWDIRIESMSIAKDSLKRFEIQPYEDGFILRFPTLGAPALEGPFQDRPKLFAVIEEHEQWGSILGVSTVGDLNALITSAAIKEMIWVAEGLHEKKISQIADTLLENFPRSKIVCIAGPSSSGKTTFAKRLAIQLRVNGFHTQQISMDDFFFDRGKIPPNSEGEQDFESIQAVDLDLLGERLEDLLKGESVPIRRFDFETGVGTDLETELRLGDWDLVILEGIHGLNPILAERLGPQRLQRIYISAITQLNIDSTHRISTSDNRLLRRLVRDHKFRSYSPQKTLERWPLVRRGEERNIFPFQEEADLMFNSALLYELPVLATYVKPLLAAVRQAPHEEEARRLETLVGFFEPLEEEIVPGVSILREFIGRSDFDY